VSDDAAVLGDATLSEQLAAASLAAARRFHRGATMWCVSPGWPHHARHVAVEFVHPVIVGKRALPALIAPAHDVVAGLRASVVPGDLVVAIAPADDPQIADLVRRADAWGIETIWIGAGPRPPAGAAHHVLWLEDGDLDAPYDGRFILLYHLLWELTHVCFEHRGLVEAAGEDTGAVCITCSDDAQLAEVVRVGVGEALVRTAEGSRTVDVSLVGELGAGDLLLVHAGSAIARVTDPDGDREVSA
jgi:hydrogenase maturation factor